MIEINVALTIFWLILWGFSMLGCATHSNLDLEVRRWKTCWFTIFICGLWAVTTIGATIILVKGG